MRSRWHIRNMEIERYTLRLETDTLLLKFLRTKAALLPAAHHLAPFVTTYMKLPHFFKRQRTYEAGPSSFAYRKKSAAEDGDLLSEECTETG